LTLTVVSAGEGVAALTDSWRIPRDQVRQMRDGLAMLQEGDRRLAAALSEVELSRASARRAGFEQGRAEGLREASDEAAAILARLAAEAGREREILRDSIGRLALEVVRRVAGELDSNAFMPALVERAVRDVLPDQPLRVRVAPGAAPSVETRLWAINAAIEVVPDDQLAELDCVLETASGRVQAGLEAQLVALERAFGEERP